MHILIVALHRPTEPTGVCRHAANLARCLAEIDKVERITLVTGAWQQQYFQDYCSLNPEKITVLGVDITNTSLSRNFWFLFGLPNLVRGLQPDLVHLSFPIPFIRSLFVCPVVATIHDLYPYKIPDNFGRKQALFNRLFLWKCIWSSDALACVSKATLEDLLHFFPDIILKGGRVRVIYNFVDFVGVAPPLKHQRMSNNSTERTLASNSRGTRSESLPEFGGLAVRFSGWETRPEKRLPPVGEPDAKSAPSRETRQRNKIGGVRVVDRTSETTSHVKIAHPQELHSKVEHPFILCVGQHRKNKNLDLLVKSYALLIRDGRLAPETRLIIVGSPGPETDNLHQLLQSLGLEDSVLMISAINDEELCWLYQNCQLVVIPSSLEGFCIPLVEALYFSCKVVCSDIPIFREIAGDNCIYFDLEGDAIANMTRSIVKALAVDISIASDNCDRFTKTAIASQYWDFYLQVV